MEETISETEHTIKDDNKIDLEEVSTGLNWLKIRFSCQLSNY
jgi:hypothetical protein